METSSPFVFDVSSDEEVGFGNGMDGGCGGGGFQFGDMDDCAWLSELLVQVGEDKDGCSSVSVCDAFRNPPENPRLEALKTPAAEIVVDVDDDDDCVVLDGDPDKPVVVAVAAKGDVDGGGDDDVVIVAEKGEVACRDFPHARHLCAKFPFASTPHRLHCTQCHCYVCDTLAPCFQWGSGIFNTNHCHATDKDKYWKIERERMKRNDKLTPPLPINTTSILPEPLFFPAQSVTQGGPHPFGRSIPVSRGRISKPTRSSLPCNSHLRVPLSSMNPHNRQQINLGRQSYLPLPQQINFGHQSYLPSLPQAYSYPYYIQTPPTYVNTSNLMSRTTFPAHMTTTFPNLYGTSSYSFSNNVIGSQLNSGITMMPPVRCMGTGSVNSNQPSQPQAISNTSSSLPNNLQQVNYGQNGVICSSSNVFKLPCDSQPLGSKESGNTQMGNGNDQLKSAAQMGNGNDHQKSAAIAIAGNHSPLTFDAGCHLPELHDRVNFLFDGLISENHYLSDVLDVPVSPLWSNR